MPLPFAFAVTLLQSTDGPAPPFLPHRSLEQGAAALAEKTAVDTCPRHRRSDGTELRAQQFLLVLRGKPATRGFFIGRRINGKSPVTAKYAREIPQKRQ